MDDKLKKVLVIGSGGREHALAWALSRSPQVEQVFVAPGNAGMVWKAGDCNGLRPGAASQNIDIPVSDFDGLIRFAINQKITLTVVGPEIPLANGIVDAFQNVGLTIFGPSQAAAQLEASKAFSKNFMAEHGIPTAESGIFEDINAAYDFLESFQCPVVVKADGLAAGKGVLICDTPESARNALKSVMQERKFGSAGDKVIIEEKLEGREFSVLAFSDGKTVRPMIVARDHKRALDGDTGLNTGGMGAFAPTSDISDAQISTIC
ncbi:MAG TPA: phosphoribosylamine--glycine ligase, partial [Aggregatilineales bacterium]|nr:phosphoribosylamine--glycine ligase [Aggregatilineales bacterium]